MLGFVLIVIEEVSLLSIFGLDDDGDERMDRPRPTVPLVITAPLPLSTVSWYSGTVGEVVSLVPWSGRLMMLLSLDSRRKVGGCGGERVGEGQLVEFVAGVDFRVEAEPRDVTGRLICSGGNGGKRVGIEGEA